jgi:hypothetical protein
VTRGQAGTGPKQVSVGERRMMLDEMTATLSCLSAYAMLRLQCM